MSEGSSDSLVLAAVPLPIDPPPMDQPAAEQVLFDAQGMDQPDQFTTMSPGAQLARQREARGWTVAEVAAQLNLAARQIKALENDDYAALPGMAIVRGFIRAYAKLLKIDATPLLASMPSNSSVGLGVSAPYRRTLPQASFSEPRFNGSTRGGSGKWYSVLLLVLILFGALAIAQHFELLPANLREMTSKMTSHLDRLGADAAATATVVQATTAPETTEAHVSPKPSSDVNSDDKAVLVQSTNAAPPDTAPLAKSLSASGSMTLLPAPPSAAAAATTTNQSATAPLAFNSPTALSKELAKPASSQLVLNLRNDSWIEIHGSQATLASKLYRAGSTEVFDISEPVQLIVGNASGVDATLRGTPLELLASTKNNVARINLK